jgi:hypothetical protein
VDFRTPDRVAIADSPKPLLAASAETVSIQTVADADLSQLLEQARIELGLETGEADMFVLDSLGAPPHAVAVVAKADAKTVAARERVMGVCAPVPYLAPGEQPGPGAGGSSPNHWARDYFWVYENREVALPSLRGVEIVTQPKHGKVVIGKNSGDDELLQYIPNAGYVGQDRIEYRVNVEGQPVKLVYFVHVTTQNLDDPDTPIFCKANTWKISLDSPDSSSDDLAAWQRARELSALISNASQTLTGFTNLTGSAIGETAGEGIDATITCLEV